MIQSEARTENLALLRHVQSMLLCGSELPNDTTEEDLRDAVTGLTRYPAAITDAVDLEMIMGVTEPLAAILLKLLAARGGDDAPKAPPEETSKIAPHMFRTAAPPPKKKRHRQGPEHTTTTGPASEVWTLIDHRERAAAKKLMDHMTKDPEKDRIREAMLPVGDIVWIERDIATGEERVLDVIVERKTIADLASSIIDERYYTQRARLWACGISHVVYLIEGDPARCYQLKEETLRGAIHSLSLREGFLVIHTENTAHSVAILEILTKRIRAAVALPGAAFRRASVLPSRLRTNSACGMVSEAFRGSLQMWTDHTQATANAITTQETFFRMLGHVPGCGSEMAYRVARVYPSAGVLREKLRAVAASSDELNAEFELTMAVGEGESADWVGGDGRRSKGVPENVSSAIYTVLGASK